MLVVFFLLFLTPRRIWDDKVILSSSWVDACVQAGQLLVEDEQWSSYTAAGTVLDIPQVQIKTEPDMFVAPFHLKVLLTSSSPLPTPRPTPISPHGSISSLFNHHLPLFTSSDFPTQSFNFNDMVDVASQQPADILQEAIEHRQRITSATKDSLEFHGVVPGPLSTTISQPLKRRSSSLEDQKPKRRRRPLFTSLSDKPYEFYVQIDHQNRHELVKTIEVRLFSCLTYLLIILLEVWRDNILQHPRSRLCHSLQDVQGLCSSTQRKTGIQKTCHFGVVCP